MDVLDDEQERMATADAGEQFGHRVVETVALEVGVGAGGVREPADPHAEVGDHTSQLASRRPEVLPEHGGLGDALQLLEGAHDGGVGRAHDGVAGSVEDEHVVGRGLVGELAHETTLARRRPRHSEAPRASRRPRRTAGGSVGPQVPAPDRRTGTTG